jgi:hypothetical protein
VGDEACGICAAIKKKAGGGILQAKDAVCLLRQRLLCRFS